MSRDTEASAGAGSSAQAAQAVHAVILRDETEAGIVMLARSLGYECFCTDLSGAHDKAGLLEKTAAAMSFPGWFGQNWDAWFDCLTDFGWQPKATGYVLVIRHALELKEAAPEAFDTALAILDDAAKVWANRGIVFRVFVDCGGQS
jgi:hypothetical protein